MKRSPMKRGPRSAAKTLRMYGSEARRLWMTQQSCLACGTTPCVSAHVGPKGTKGMGYKSDAKWCVPLCPPHHAEADDKRKTFAAKYGLDLELWAMIIDARWEREQAVKGTP